MNTEPPRERAGALVLREGTVLLVYRKNARGAYYVVPGGGVEDGETPELAAAREIQEEAGIGVTIGRKVLDLPDNGVNRRQHVFLAELMSDPGLITWQEDRKQRPDNEYRLEWVPIADIAAIDLRPAELKPLLASL